ncbi:MAG TPA: VOC family protein [Thermomicrobiales bacterium]|jgi:predicted enzyme related to lactoylglutathione lyase
MSATLAPPTLKTGRFVWRDLQTSDPERAKAFYTELFGWTVKPMGMGDFTYDMLANGGKEFGGIVPLDPASGAPSHWVSYVHVPSVDESVDAAGRLGGTVYLSPTDIPGVGRFAIVADPQGAVVSPFTSADESDDWPTEMSMPPVGDVTWNELITADVEGAKRFYGDVIGWQFEASDMPGPVQYHILKQGDRWYGGLMQKPDEVPVSLWVIYYHVADLDQTLTEIARLGGQPAGEVIEVPNIGRVSWATDPTGALFALHEAPK